MNTLLATNIFLATIVVTILILTILLTIVLVNLIRITQRIKHVVTVFDDDVVRARSVVVAMKELIVEKLFGKVKKK